MRILPFFLGPFFLGFCVSALAAPSRFDFRDAIQRNLIEISMQGPLERTTALSHYLYGWAEGDPENLGLGIKGELEFDTRTLETGLEGKNIFMKERLLESNQYPLFQATFSKKPISVTGKATEPEGAKLRTEITLKIKGQTRTLVLPLTIHYHKESELTRQRLPGNLLSIACDTVLSLGKLGISIPDNYRSAAATEVRLILHAVGSDRLPVGISSLPNGFKPKEPVVSSTPAKAPGLYDQASPAKAPGLYDQASPAKAPGLYDQASPAKAPGLYDQASPAKAPGLYDQASPVPSTNTLPEKKVE